MILGGYATFKSKDKTKDYYKILVFREITEREKEFGNVGMKSVEKFITPEAFSDLSEDMIGKNIELAWGGNEFSPQIIGVTLA